MTGGSPFLTNSYSPANVLATPPNIAPRSQLTRQFIPRQPKRILDNLLVQIALDLKQNLADRHSARPMIETALSLPHSALVAARVHTNVRRDPHVQPELHPTKPFPDGVLRNLQLRRRNATIVIAHPQSVVSPNDVGAAHAAARRHTTTTFPGLLVFTSFWHEPVEAGWGCGECAEGGPYDGLRLGKYCGGFSCCSNHGRMGFVRLGRAGDVVNRLN